MGVGWSKWFVKKFEQPMQDKNESRGVSDSKLGDLVPLRHGPPLMLLAPSLSIAAMGSRHHGASVWSSGMVTLGLPDRGLSSAELWKVSLTTRADIVWCEQPRRRATSRLSSNSRPQYLKLKPIDPPVRPPRDESSLHGARPQMMKACVRNFLQRISGGRLHVGPVSAEVPCPRLVSKDGHVNIVLDNLSTQYHLTMMADMWTTFLELGWRCKCAMFFIVYLGSWLLFGLIWFAVASSHRDLSTSNSTQEHKPCVHNVKNVMGAFLYSVETQVTIGYGSRALTDNCPVAMLVLVLQSLCGLFIDAVVCGAIIAQLAMPWRRARCVRWSHYAVVAPRDDHLVLLLRFVDHRRSALLGARISCRLIHIAHTTQGHTVVLNQEVVEFVVDSSAEVPFVAAPFTAMHVIDGRSPLRTLTSSRLRASHFELIVLLDSTSETSSDTCQARTSYLPDEIIWGGNFCPLPIVAFPTVPSLLPFTHSHRTMFRVDMRSFDRTLPVETPHCLTCLKVGSCEDCKSGIPGTNPAFETDEVSTKPLQIMMPTDIPGDSALNITRF
uniref:ATP-sensitive inward rectifier potassium channel 1-like n=1 Tax=Myxine glutinosa TaxID=7769 RepID=UPI00358FBCB7